MSRALLSVGLDVGTTSTQMIVSRLTVENKASAFAVPALDITDREILYESPVHFTPLVRGELIDGAGLERLVALEYDRAGITRQQVDTGAVIITGETSRKENAATVASALSQTAGDFVVATAGPDLESVLAARGAGVVDRSLADGRKYFHFDIGGGTSNLCLVENGQVAATGCLNVGGRLVKLTESGEVTYISPVLAGLLPYKAGQTITEEMAMETARLLCAVLEMAAGLREKDSRFSQLTTGGTSPVDDTVGAVLSFSGGVAQCIKEDAHWLRYGDLGVLLGRAIRESGLLKQETFLPEKPIRATVIGAGCHSAQLSGSTVFLQNARLPRKNLPVVPISREAQHLPQEALTALLKEKLSALDTPGVLHFPGEASPGYGFVTALARAIAPAVEENPCYVALEADMAKALGHALSLRLPKQHCCICIDNISLPRQSYLDIGAMVGPAVPVVVKTLIFEV